MASDHPIALPAVMSPNMPAKVERLFTAADVRVAGLLDVNGEPYSKMSLLDTWKAVRVQ